MASRISASNNNLANTQLERICALDINTNPVFCRLSGIICTIGPASRDPETLEKMMENGMIVARLNLSHGTHAYHKDTIKNIRTASKNYKKKYGISPSVAIALDTRGREIRTGLLEGGGSAEIELVRGETIRLTTDKLFAEKGNQKAIFVNYQNITKVVKPGNRIFIDDGLISLICKQVEHKELICTIENGGKLGSRKGINLPGVTVDLPTISEIDKIDLKFGIEENVDMVFSSFTASAATVKEMRNILGEKGKNIMIVSKIENEEGIKNLTEIIEASDGLMVERGDLGSEIPLEKVFLAQKVIIARCNKAGKPVICATQMLESMTDKPRPTRAESADVANAILDGADCVMLSGETAKGLYPLECVATMAKICREAEAVIWSRTVYLDLSNQILFKNVTSTIATAAVEASMKILASAIIVVTTTGKSAHMISRYRPKCPVIAITRNPQVARQCHLYRAILPVHYEEGPLDDWLTDVDARVNFGIHFGKKQGFIKTGDTVIVVTGWQQGTGFTNTMRIIKVSDEIQNICVLPKK